MNTGATWAAATVSGLGISIPSANRTKAFLLFFKKEQKASSFLEADVKTFACQGIPWGGGPVL
jgi:hypothetical protein